MSTTWTVGPAGDFATIHAAIDAATTTNGDTISISNGTYVQSGTLNVNKDITLLGESEAGVIIDFTGVDGYGILLTGDGATLSNFTVLGPATGTPSGNYGIKAQPDSADPADNLTGITIENVTVRGSLRSEIDLNGVDNSTLRNVTADGNNTDGVGIALTDSTGITLENITTTGNNWGSIALYTSGTYYEPGTANITFQGTYTQGEPVGIFSQDESPSADLGTVTFPPSFTADGDGVYTVTNDSFRGALGDSNTFAFFFGTQAEAVAFALTLSSNDRSVIEAPDGKFVVASGMSVQAAIDAALAGDTIVVAAGTYVEQVVVDGKSDLTIKAVAGASVVIEAPSDVTQTVLSSSGRAINAVITVIDSNNVTIEGVGVDGNGVGNTVDGPNANFVGVAYRNASGSLLDVDITGIHDAYPGGTTVDGFPIQSGNQRGVGLQVDNDADLAFTMTGGSISDFQKNGTVFNHAILDVTGATITGGGAQTIIAQNGIQALNSTGTIANNTVTDIGYADTTTAWYSTGMHVTATNVSITGLAFEATAPGTVVNKAIEAVADGFSITDSIVGAVAGKGISSSVYINELTVPVGAGPSFSGATINDYDGTAHHRRQGHHAVGGGARPDHHQVPRRRGLDRQPGG